MTINLVRDTVNPRIAHFLDKHEPPSPCLVMDLEMVAERYHNLRRVFPDARIFYAVKANPEPELVRLLLRFGASFDVASSGEIDLCLRAGASPGSLSYGNTVKKPEDIKHAYALGIRLFAFDSAVELDKIAHLAPGSAVFCRILTSNEGAGWPLGHKFGCSMEMAVDLLRCAERRGLEPYGVSFHVGSQQLNPSRWEAAIAQSEMVFAELERTGIRPQMLNIGGGLPAHYIEDIPPLEVYGQVIGDALRSTFGPGRVPALAMEPGRYIVGDAGILRTTVVLVSRKAYGDEERWVYLDAGRYGGLAESEGEMIKYRITTAHASSSFGPVVLAGPTCDSADVLYQNTVYQLPLSLDVGDHVDLLSAGAYTTSYSAAAFNGFKPPQICCIGDPS